METNNENNNGQTSGRGVVKFNAHGGHFYIDSQTNRPSPPNDADAASDIMYQWLSDLNETHGWEVTTHHIEDGVPICEVSWSGSDEYHVDYDFDLPDGLSMDWYSKERKWDDI